MTIVLYQWYHDQSTISMVPWTKNHIHGTMNMKLKICISKQNKILDEYVVIWYLTWNHNKSMTHFSYPKLSSTITDIEKIIFFLFFHFEFFSTDRWFQLASEYISRIVGCNLICYMITKQDGIMVPWYRQGYLMLEEVRLLWYHGTLAVNQFQ